VYPYAALCELFLHSNILFICLVHCARGACSNWRSTSVDLGTIAASFERHSLCFHPGSPYLECHHALRDGRICGTCSWWHGQSSNNHNLPCVIVTGGRSDLEVI